MERILNSVENVWSRESFCASFGFKIADGGFEKVINGNSYTFKKVNAPDELKEVVNIQKLAWGWDDKELAPVHILSLWEDTGGGVFAAYKKGSEKMVGFAGGMGGGIDPLTGKPVIISSMLAMAGTDHRSRGFGRELKIIQAYYANQQGYGIMKWLYDPERGENASLNIRKLGAKCEEFYIDKYGVMLSDLYGPVPTDRFRAVWRFTEQETIGRLQGKIPPPTFEDVCHFPTANSENFPDAPKVLVQISGDIDAETEQLKISRRRDLRRILSHYFFEKNYIATEFISEGSGVNRKNFYLLESAATLSAKLES